MKPIPVFGSGIKSRSANANTQERVNIYLEQSDDKSSTVAYGTPGLTLFANLGDSPIRGMHVVGELLYVVYRSVFYSINNAGVATVRGTLLTGSGHVSMDDNGLEIMIVDGPNGYIYTIATTTLAEITDGDFPGGNTVTFLDSFFLVNKPSSAQFHKSASYNGAAWDALEFATAESGPDNLVAVKSTQSRAVLFGERSIEHWAHTGALDFPFSRISGATSDWGLAARQSVASFNSSLIFLAKSRHGEVQVCWLNGYTLERVSTHDLENLINNYSGVSDATGLSFIYNGHQFYQLNFTSVGKSWLYDGASGLWSELKTDAGRHLSDKSVTFIDSIKTASYTDGKIFTVNGNDFTDDGIPIRSSFTTKHSFNNLERASISELQVDCETGNGVNIEPRIMMQVSKDGGHTWSNERFGNLGVIGDYKARARFTRLGQAEDWVFRFSITDPVKRVILGVWINA